MTDLINQNAATETQEVATSDVENVQAEMEGGAGDASEVAETATPAATKLDDVNKEYFPSGKLEEAQEAIGKVQAIVDEHDLGMVFNFDTEADFPAGYGLAIAPITKNIDGKNTIKAVAIAAIPDLETVQAAEGGQQFVAKCVVGSMIAKLQNAVRPRGETGETAASIPYSVADFITSNRPEGVLLAYRKLASAYVKVLKKKGLTYITESILRQILQSSAFAEQQFPTIDQAKWEQILDSMIARAVDDELAPGMLTEWRKTRDSAELVDASVDLSDIDFDDLMPIAETTETATAEGDPAQQ